MKGVVRFIAAATLGVGGLFLTFVGDMLSTVGESNFRLYSAIDKWASRSPNS